MNEQTNYIFLQGEIVTEPKITYSREEENFYEFTMKVNRQSDKFDLLNIVVSERIFDKVKNEKFITLFGEIRTRNLKDENDPERSHLSIYIFGKDCQLNIDKKYENEVNITGYICKKPVYRTTPFNREICDLLLAVNRMNGKRSDYIPSIAWGRNATFAGELEIGTKISASGRFQSREYTKTIGDQSIVKTAYEFSINSLNKVEENDNK